MQITGILKLGKHWSAIASSILCFSFMSSDIVLPENPTPIAEILISELMSQSSNKNCNNILFFFFSHFEEYKLSFH